MIAFGLDEAALGPSLGPFCACLTSFETEDNAPADLYRVLSDVVSADKNDDRRFTVADSKVLYSRSTGIGSLENNVTAFLKSAGLTLPCSFAQLLSSLCSPGDVSALSESPWYADAEKLTIPESLENLNLTDYGLKMAAPELRFVTARSFNRELEDGGGKGTAVRNILTPLLRSAVGGNGEDVKRRVTVDRQGGRRYYGEWLAELLPGAPLRALEEGSKRSAYEAGGLQVEFLVGADGFCMETALASMIAKYARECAMKLFNDWWVRRVPGIRPTAGYPQDARRFVADLEAAGALPAEKDFLIRRL